MAWNSETRFDEFQSILAWLPNVIEVLVQLGDFTVQIWLVS